MGNLTSIDRTASDTKLYEEIKEAIEEAVERKITEIRAEMAESRDRLDYSSAPLAPANRINGIIISVGASIFFQISQKINQLLFKLVVLQNNSEFPLFSSTPCSLQLRMAR